MPQPKRKPNPTPNKSSTKAKPKPKSKPSSSRKAPSTPNQSSEATTSRTSSTAVTLDTLDQPLLDVFARALSSALSDLELLQHRVQEVKGKLYARDFDGAFGGGDEMREAYVARWSPGRAVGFLRVWERVGVDFGKREEQQVEKEGRTEAEVKQEGEGGQEEKEREEESRFKVVCLGAGPGAELVSLAGWWRLLVRRDEKSRRKRRGGNELEDGGESQDRENSASISTTAEEEISSASPNVKPVDSGDLDSTLDNLSLNPSSSSKPEPQSSRIPPLHLHLIDLYPWRPTQLLLLQSLTSSNSTSSYISTSRIPAPLLPRSHIHLTTSTANLLALSSAALSQHLRDARLITLMFTLNELFAANVGQTLAFLRRLGSCPTLKAGARLVVADSAGSYADVPLGGDGVGKDGEKRRYPLGWVLEYGLCGRESADTDRDEGSKPRGGKGWEREVRDESYWVRLPPGLRYPVKLEDMRMQVHVYRKAGTEEP